MKKATLALVISLLIHVGSLYAGCKSEACKRAVAWKNGYAAIVLEDEITPNDYLAVLDVVKRNKGVVAIEAERVLLGWVPTSAAGKIRATRGVRALLYNAVARPADLVRREYALPALEFFNRVSTGEYEDAVEAGLSVIGQPLNGCVVQRPTSLARAQLLSLAGQSDAYTAAENEVLGEGERNTMDREHAGEPPQRTGRVSPNFWFRTPYQNPDMRGRVTVQVFRLDSNGNIDPNLYTWTSADFNFAGDQIYAAFTFWVNQATARGITLSFRVSIEDPLSRHTRSIVPTAISYEPITRSSADDYLWVDNALATKGYAASPVTAENVYTQNEAFNRFRLGDIGGPYDRSFSVYVVYNPAGAPTVFANGQRAYSMYDGPFTTVMWNSAGWGPNNLNLVLTHESGHIFWACDEYYDAPTQTGCFTCDSCFYNVGPRNQIATPWIRNANCDNPGATACDIPRVGCMMRALSTALCSHTPGQIGW